MGSRHGIAIAAVALAAAAGGCGGGNEQSTAQRRADPALVAKAHTAIQRLSQETLSKGPNGETAVSAETVRLTPDEIAKVKAKNATAAIVLHYGGNDWSTAQVDGLRSEFERLGIKVIAVTDRQLQAEQQVVRHPDRPRARSRRSSCRLPTDPVADAPAYKQAAQAGREARLHGQRPDGHEGRQGLRQRRSRPTTTATASPPRT